MAKKKTDKLTVAVRKAETKSTKKVKAKLKKIGPSTRLIHKTGYAEIESRSPQKTLEWAANTAVLITRKYGKSAKKKSSKKAKTSKKKK